MEQIVRDIVHGVTRAVELLGIVTILIGAVFSTTAFLGALRRAADRDSVVREYRTGLGRAILLGLEFLVAADIINTVAIEPTLGSVAVLGGIVLIRTFLSFSLEVEIDGCWPWRRNAERSRAASQTAPSST